MEANSNVNAKNVVGDTPLHHAAFHGYKACMQILLAAQAQVELVNNDGCTALTRAIQLNEFDCAELLLHAGSKIEHVKVPIPEWMNEIVAKYNNFKVAYTVFYGILRRRMDIPFLLNPIAAKPPDGMLLICSTLLKTRYNTAWGNKWGWGIF